MLAIAALLVLQIAVFPPLDEPDTPPEGPPPPRAPRLSVAPNDPIAPAPDARDLLTSCENPVFTECFKSWRPPPPPPPPPPEPEKPIAPAPGKVEAPPAASGPAATPPPPPPDASKPPEKPEPPFGTGSPPPPNPESDKATYDALVKAIRDTGIEGKVLLPDPPKNGNTTMELAPGADKRDGRR